MLYKSAENTIKKRLRRCPPARVMKSEPDWEAARLQCRGEGGSGRLLQPRRRPFPSSARGRRAAPALRRGGSCGRRGGRMRVPPERPEDTRVHLFAAGGCGGTVGALLTCPLEAVKTRLQSSSGTLHIPEVQLNTMARASVDRLVSPGPLHCLKVILEKEGPRSLFRGLGRNLLGVAPPRAIYFAAYSIRTEKLNGLFDPDSTQVHDFSCHGRHLLYISPEKRVRSCHLMLPIRRSLPVEIWTNLNLVVLQSQRPTPFG